MPYTGTISNIKRNKTAIEVKKGNAIALDILCKDAAGVALTNLATATEVYIMLKESLTDVDADAVINKNLTAGTVSVDSPSAGYITATLTSEDTEDLEVQTYWLCAQIEYSDANKQELDLQDSNEYVLTKIKITQDGIRG